MNNVIRGYCRTNRDDYRTEEWPKAFAALPREGDWIESRSGAVLKVCKVTHLVLWPGQLTAEPNLEIGQPYIEVELTTRA